MSRPVPFGSYELLEKIAVGGMAEVFRARARHAAGVSRTVCLKRIHPALSADPAFVQMFIEEARVSLALVHPNIVPAFDFGCVDGQHFLALELVDGRDLASVLGRAHIVRRSFPPELAVHVVMEVLEGLAYAHGWKDESGRSIDVVHRDVSPSNAMVTRAGQVKVLDFGIARSALREVRTRTGVIKGKPGYMAPEQASGGQVDARTDVYACGVLLVELVTGERPTLGERLEPSRAGRLVGEGALGAAVERALALRPEGRHESAARMRDALAAWLEEAELRPSAAALAAFVDSLFGAEPDATDWSIAAPGLDRHLAALAAGEEPVPAEASTELLERERDGGAAAEPTLETGRPFGADEQTERSEPDLAAGPAEPGPEPAPAPPASPRAPRSPSRDGDPRGRAPRDEPPRELAEGRSTTDVVVSFRPRRGRAAVAAVALLLAASLGLAVHLSTRDASRPAVSPAAPRTEAAAAIPAGPRPAAHAADAGAGAPASPPPRPRPRPARAPAASPAPEPDAAPAEPDQQTRRRIQGALASLRPYLRLCLSRASPPMATATVRFRVDGEGRATYLGTSPSPPEAVSWCLDRAVGAARLPATGRAPITVTHTVNLPELDR